MTLSGFDDYSFGAQQNLASYNFDGTNYALDYYWDDSSNINTPCGNVLVTQYHLHLEGVVSHVPIPAAAWLFCSGLLGLIGITRRRKVS